MFIDTDDCLMHRSNAGQTNVSQRDIARDRSPELLEVTGILI